PGDEGPAGHLVQHLGPAALHAGPEPGGEDHDDRLRHRPGTYNITSALRLAVAVALGAIALLGAPGAARAHQSSATFARLEATDDPARLRYGIKIAARDRYEALALGSDREATAGGIRAGGGRLHAHLAERAALSR